MEFIFLIILVGMFFITASILLDFIHVQSFAGTSFSSIALLTIFMTFMSVLWHDPVWLKATAPLLRAISIALFCAGIVGKMTESKWCRWSWPFEPAVFAVAISLVISPLIFG